MSNEERHHDDSSQSATPSQQDTHTLLVRLLDLLAARIAEKLQSRSPAKPRQDRRTDRA